MLYIIHPAIHASSTICFFPFFLVITINSQENLISFSCVHSLIKPITANLSVVGLSRSGMEAMSRLRSAPEVSQSLIKLVRRNKAHLFFENSNHIYMSVLIIFISNLFHKCMSCLFCEYTFYTKYDKFW